MERNILGYDIGEIAARGAITTEIVALPAPMQAFIDVQYMDSKAMDKRPGMHLKYLPYRFDEVSGKLLNGGSYLFDTWEDAQDYKRWTVEDFQVDDHDGKRIKFWDRAIFESHISLVWKVVGACNFAPVEEHAVGRLEKWTYEGEDAETALEEAYPALKSAAEEQGARAIWLLHDPREKMIGIQLAFKRLGKGDHDSAHVSLAAATQQPSLVRLLPSELRLRPLFNRTSLLLTLWLPRSRNAGGSELTIPFYPMVPDISLDHK